jgi:predicted nucleic acid-binding protein
MILIDSCIYIPLLRRGMDPAEEFSVLAEEFDIVTCGVVRCEITRGLKTQRARERLSAWLDVQVYVPTMHRVWARAEQIAWETGKMGQTIPLTDAIIAACALESGSALLTLDRHFTWIAGLTILTDYPRPGEDAGSGESGNG